MTKRGQGSLSQETPHLNSTKDQIPSVKGHSKKRWQWDSVTLEQSTQMKGADRAKVKIISIVESLHLIDNQIMKLILGIF
ncbi:hypothetical protein C1H46_009351 [Malus baccata]|uniref:Uncharacterized protein n=1 Tax=Malus baccata TaxID=106549 RepID=A0A540N213_MALBA|nr:hypothetical protein C1H46_009351 [Malus baccata]